MTTASGTGVVNQTNALLTFLTADTAPLRSPVLGIAFLCHYPVRDPG